MALLPLVFTSRNELLLAVMATAAPCVVPGGLCVITRGMALNIKIVFAYVTLAMGLSASAAEPSDNMAGAKTKNGRIAMEWVDMAFNHHRMGEAFDRYVSRDDYMNHAVPKGQESQTFDGQKALETSVLNMDSKFEIVQIIAQSDLVAMHIHVTHRSDSGFSRELAEFIRVRNGKIVDHWDWHVAVPKDGLQFVDVDRFNRPKQ